MALSASSMAARIEAYVAAVSSVQTTVGHPIGTYRLAILEAFCQGIIDEIHANAVTHDTDTHGDTGTGTVE